MRWTSSLDVLLWSLPKMHGKHAMSWLQISWACEHHPLFTADPPLEVQVIWQKTSEIGCSQYKPKLCLAPIDLFSYYLCLSFLKAAKQNPTPAHPDGHLQTPVLEDPATSLICTYINFAYCVARIKKLPEIYPTPKGKDRKGDAQLIHLNTIARSSPATAVKINAKKLCWENIMPNK